VRIVGVHLEQRLLHQSRHNQRAADAEDVPRIVSRRPCARTIRIAVALVAPKDDLLRTERPGRSRGERLAIRRQLIRDVFGNAIRPSEHRV